MPVLDVEGRIGIPSGRDHESVLKTLALKDDPYQEGTERIRRPQSNPEFTPTNLPEVHDTLRQLRRCHQNEFPGRILIGETYLPDVGELAKMYGRNNDELQLPMDTQAGFTNKLSAQEFRTKLRDAEGKLNGNTPLLVFENHDNPRSINRYGDGKHDGEGSRGCCCHRCSAAHPTRCGSGVPG